MTSDKNNEYEDDYYETSDFDMIHFDEEYDEDISASNGNDATPPSKKPGKKKKRLEDWLEEKRLRDGRQDDIIDP